MPQTLTLDFSVTGSPAVLLSVEVATVEELLAFANKVRETAGGDFLGALLPGHALDSAQCLIARNLNFHSEVLPVDTYSEHLQWPSGAWKWMMAPSDPAVAELVAAKLDLELIDNPEEDSGEERKAVVLPEQIGNAAKAFDERKAFIDYHAASI